MRCRQHHDDPGENYSGGLCHDPFDVRTTERVLSVTLLDQPVAANFDP
jgi:hypothetical protein